MPNENRNQQPNRQQGNPNQDIRKDKPMAGEKDKKWQKDQDEEGNFRQGQGDQQKRSAEKRAQGAGY